MFCHVFGGFPFFFLYFVPLVTEKVVLSSKSWFGPANGMPSTHLLVEIHNVYNFNLQLLVFKFWMYFWLNHCRTCHQILTLKYFFSTWALFVFRIEQYEDWSRPVPVLNWGCMVNTYQLYAHIFIFLNKMKV